jgi:hypothetical protein
LWAASVLAAHTSIESHDLVDQVVGWRAEAGSRRVQACLPTPQLKICRLDKDAHSVMLGGLEEASGPFLLRVRGHNALGQLVCEGVLSGVSLKRR